MSCCLLTRKRPRWCVLPWVAFLALTGLATPLSAGAAERQQLKDGYVPAAVARLVSLGTLPSAQRLNLAIGLPLRNGAELNVLLQQLYDPASPNYRHYLTPEEFTAQFGPTEQDYQALIDFAGANGLTVTHTHPNRLVLDVAGAVPDIEKTFNVTLRTYQHPTEARTFYAPDVEPSVEFALPILHVSGLDNYSIPHPNIRIKPASASANATPNAGSSPSGSYMGSDFRNAYVPGTTLTGVGQNVGLLQFDGFYTNDITSYESQAGLPNVPLTVVPVDGGVRKPGSGASEVSLDIEMVISMAPGVSRVYVFEAPNPSPWVDLLSTMATYTTIHQFSCSWGSTDPPDASSEAVFKQMASQGQSFFNATGDSDAFTGSIGFPSDSPNITQVGGTTLTTGSGATYSSETVWNRGGGTGSSGGISTYYGIPSYQLGVSMTANQGSTTMRNVPDVALTGDNVYVIYSNGKTATFGGTSCAAPLWAGFTALVNQQAAALGSSPVGFLNPALYNLGKSGSYAADFHDITTGNNFSSSSPSQFSAVTGYDLCTGWGTPNGANLINALTGPPLALPPAITTQPANQTAVVGANASFSVTATGTAPLAYQWAFGGTNLAGATASTLLLNSVQPTQAGSYAVVVTNVAGSVTSAVASLTVLGATVVSNSFTLVAEGCPNGVVDPAETVTVSFGLKNIGTANTANLVATLLPTGGILSPSGPQTYGVLVANGAAVAMPLTFTATGSCGGTNTASLQLQDGTVNLGTVTFSFRLGQSSVATVFSQNFDAVTAPALPAGWTTSASGAESAWVTSTSARDTTPNSVFSPDPGNVGVNELDSPAITLPAGPAQLTFRHNYDLEPTYDGGVLEIKIGGGSWTDILTAGGSFVSGPYVTVISSSWSNPLGGRSAWTGTSGDFITTAVNLPSAASGQTIQLRWRCGSDSGVSATGWYVDTVSITSSNSACCTASADLGVSLAATQDSLLAGQNLTYSLAVTNLGPSSASSVTLTDTLPAGATFVSASPGCVNLGGKVICNVGSLSSGGGSNFTVTVAASTGGSITNTLTVASPTTDPNSANNSATVVTTIHAPPTLTIQTASLAGPGISIIFPSIVGLNYVLEYKHSLADLTWTSLPPTVAGTGGVMTLQDANASTDSRYYRLRCE